MDMVDAGLVEPISVMSASTKDPSSGAMMMDGERGRERRRNYSISPSSKRIYNSRSRSRSRSPLARPMPNGGGQRGQVVSEPSTILGVFGLHPRTRERDLEDVFSGFGSVSRVMLVFDRRSGHSRGFGFIYFTELEEAKKALEKTNGMMLDGRAIRVDYSATKRPHSPTPGQYMGRRSTSSRHDDRYRSNRRGYSRSRSPQRRRYRSRSHSRSRYAYPVPPTTSSSHRDPYYQHRPTERGHYYRRNAGGGYSRSRSR